MAGRRHWPSHGNGAWLMIEDIPAEGSNTEGGKGCPLILVPQIVCKWNGELPTELIWLEEAIRRAEEAYRRATYPIFPGSGRCVPIGTIVEFIERMNQQTDLLETALFSVKKRWPALVKHQSNLAKEHAKSLPPTFEEFRACILPEWKPHYEQAHYVGELLGKYWRNYREPTVYDAFEYARQLKAEMAKPADKRRIPPWPPKSTEA